jgi:hypothetical protein
MTNKELNVEIRDVAGKIVKEPEDISDLYEALKEKTAQLHETTGISEIERDAS